MKVKYIFVYHILAVSLVSFSMTNGFSQDAKDVLKKFDPYATIYFELGVLHQSDKNNQGHRTTHYWDLCASSNFGLNFTHNNLTAKVEIGLDETGPKFRKGYFSYNFGIGSFFIGQNFTPYTRYSEQKAIDYDSFTSLGGTCDGLRPMIMLNIKGAYLALVQPSLDLTQGNDNNSPSGNNIVFGTRQELFIPKIAVGYDYKHDKFNIGTSFIIQHQVVASAGPFRNENLLSYMVTLHGGMSIAKFKMELNAAYSMNPGNMGFWTLNNLNTKAMANSAGNGIKDTQVLEGFIDFGYNFGILIINTGVAYIQGYNPRFNTIMTDGTNVDRQMTAYGGVTFPFWKYFSVTLECSYYDYLNQGEGNDIYGLIFLQASI